MPLPDGKSDAQCKPNFTEYQANGPSILLASDSERLGPSIHRTLQEQGFEVHYAGPYSALEAALHGRSFDVILLEVTGQHAVEAAVAAALRLKRANPEQFIGYLADPALDASGLAGDGLFPRSSVRLAPALHAFFAGREISKP